MAGSKGDRRRYETGPELEVFSAARAVLARHGEQQQLQWEEMDFHIEEMAQDLAGKECQSRKRVPRRTEYLAI
jgi:hypothetical protein